MQESWSRDPTRDSHVKQPELVNKVKQLLMVT
jgi:hypothetical protein